MAAVLLRAVIALRSWLTHYQQQSMLQPHIPLRVITRMVYWMGKLHGGLKVDKNKVRKATKAGVQMD